MAARKDLPLRLDEAHTAPRPSQLSARLSEALLEQGFARAATPVKWRFTRRSDVVGRGTEISPKRPRSR